MVSTPTEVSSTGGSNPPTGSGQKLLYVYGYISSVVIKFMLNVFRVLAVMALNKG